MRRITSIATAILPHAAACLLRILLVSAVLPSVVTIAHAESPALQEIDDETFADRPIAEVLIEGNDRVKERFIRNNLRTAAGQPYDAQSLRNDVTTLEATGKFKTVIVKAERMPDGGSMRVTYTVSEQPQIQDVQTVGNTLVSDQELKKIMRVRPGVPLDPDLVEQSRVAIKNLYQKKGHTHADVTVDESRFHDTGLLIFQIVEGPRVRIRQIEFNGNTSFPDSKLTSKIQTKPAIRFFRMGELDDELLRDDKAAIHQFYREHGFRDVRVDYREWFGPESKDAKVVFQIVEGEQYRLRSIEIQGFGAAATSPLEVFSDEQLLGLAAIRPGAIFLEKAIQDTLTSIEEAYLQMGYLDVQVSKNEVRANDEGEMDLFIEVIEGKPFKAGLVLIQGNFITKDKVIRRLVRILPGRPVDGATLEKAKERLEQTRLFHNVRITTPRPQQEDPEIRDVIVEIKERNTGSVNFGVGFGSDAGILGEFSVNQNNFDIADFPMSVEELLAARAFRGAGQQFSLTIAPGNEIQNYAIDLTEPHLFESDISARGSFFYQRRVYQQYDEDRLNSSFILGQRLGDVWVGNIATSFQRVVLKNFDRSMPLEIANDAGPDVFASISANLKRTTINNLMRPSSGSVVNFGISKFLAIKGDVDFWKVNGGLTTFLTLYEDLLGHKQVLKLKTQCGYIFGGTAPTYEQYYLGGQSLRGFEYRTISPKSTRTVGGTGPPEPIGGTWEFFAGAQYEVPLIGDSMALVAFVDSGTVTDTPSLDNYRVSLGVGLRLYIPQLGPAPLAFDFGFPVLKESTDQTQLFSFNAELPF